MKLTKQRFRHRPEDGIYGDCHRTVIACLLDLEPEDVPHEHREMTGEEFSRLYESWLAERGVSVIDVPLTAETLEQALECGARFGRGMPYILGGESRTGVNHSVLCQGREIIHDPSLTDAGIVGPTKPDGLYWLTWLVRPLS